MSTVNLVIHILLAFALIGDCPASAVRRRRARYRRRHVWSHDRTGRANLLTRVTAGLAAFSSRPASCWRSWPAIASRPRSILDNNAPEPTPAPGGSGQPVASQPRRPRGRACANRTCRAQTGPLSFRTLRRFRRDGNVVRLAGMVETREFFGLRRRVCLISDGGP